MLRVPAWCEGAAIRVNGRRVLTKDRVRGYVRVQRTWHEGDVVELRLPMPVRMTQAHPKVTENRGRVALTRGPIVYCVETTEEMSTLARDPELTVERWPDRLGGIVAIRGMSAESPALWDRALYASIPRPSPRRHPFVAIPFYAFGNEGRAKMAVWLDREL